MSDDKARQLGQVRAAIGDARREINRNNSPIARAIIKPFYMDSDSIVGTPEWADLSLIMAESLSAENKVEAEAYFVEFFNRAKEAFELPPELTSRAHENFGHFLVSKLKRPDKARTHYAEAKALSVKHGFAEASARTQLKILSIDLDASEDRQAANLKLLLTVARDEGFTSQQAFVAWTLHLEQLSRTAQGRTYARNADAALRQYFSRLLNQARATEESENCVD
jgi:hypothetical protein